jgi:DNA-binding response OmpR family regulator
VLEAEPVHVLVADEKMPGMPGSDLLAVARRRWPETIRMILTGHTADELARQAAVDGDAHRVFTKPIAGEELAAAIQAALASASPPAGVLTRPAAGRRVHTNWYVCGGRTAGNGWRAC